MKRVTKTTGESGTDRAKCPTSTPRDISQDPDMIELKRLVARLSPERRQDLDDFLEEISEARPHLNRYLPLLPFDLYQLEMRFPP